MILYTILLLSLLATLSILTTTMRNRISPTPTSYKVKKNLLKLLEEESPHKIVDLGAGWGTLVFPIAKQHPEATVVGYENSLIPFLFMKIRQMVSKTPNLMIERRNFYKENLSSYDIVICYLFPLGMKKLKDKFTHELKNGTSIYTHTFSIPGWTPTQKWKVKDLYRSTIFQYKISKQEKVND
ncbi:methyltransferase [Bacillus pinisoli]|uniref:methyltransferase n=1 Tax=Bacillus pinisoli TaxID=2901866 RepID=UPI001FF203AC|nr:methyltransferase [Bacillus pinisoli]